MNHGDSEKLKLISQIKEIVVGDAAIKFTDNNDNQVQDSNQKNKNLDSEDAPASQNQTQHTKDQSVLISEKQIQSLPVIEINKEFISSDGSENTKKPTIPVEQEAFQKHFFIILDNLIDNPEKGIFYCKIKMKI